MRQKVKDKISQMRNDFDLVELVKGSFLSLVGKVLGMIFGYLVVLFIANNYGATTLGFYSLSLAVLSLAVLIPKFGFDNSLVRLLNEVKIKGNKLNFFSVVKRTSFFAFVLSVVASVILYFLSNKIAITIFKNPELSSSLRSISLAIVPTTLLVFISGIYQSFKSTFYHMLYKTAAINVLFLILLVSNYYVFKKFDNLLSIYCVATYAVLVLAFITVRRKLSQVKFNEDEYFNFKNREILNITYPMLFANSFALFLGWINIILLGYFIAESDVGIYDSTERLAAFTNIVLIAINSIAAPKFAEAYSKNDKNNLKFVTKKSTKMIFYLTLPILILMVTFGKYILLMFGPEFVVGYWALFFLCIGRFVSSIAGSVGYLLQMTGEQKIYQNIIFLALVINFGLCWLLIPIYGIVGAAIAKCTAVVFWNITLVLIVKKRLGFWTLYIPFVTK